MSDVPPTLRWPRAILFDLDGTLIDSAADIRDAVNQLLARDVTQIDLRVAGIVTLKPGELAAAQIAKTSGKPHVAKGSSEYETPAEKKSDGTSGNH